MYTFADLHSLVAPDVRTVIMCHFKDLISALRRRVNRGDTAIAVETIISTHKAVLEVVPMVPSIIMACATLPATVMMARVR